MLGFSLREISVYCNISMPTLRRWLQAGDLVPARPGGPGPRNGHSFSYQQALALLSVSCTRNKEGGYIGPTYLKATLRAFASISDETLADGLSPEGRHVPHTLWPMEAARRGGTLSLEPLPPEQLAQYRAEVAGGLYNAEDWYEERWEKLVDLMREREGCTAGV